MPDDPAADPVSPRDALHSENRIPGLVTNPLAISRTKKHKPLTGSFNQVVMKRLIPVFAFFMYCSHLVFAAQDYLEKIPSGVKAEDYVPGALVKTDYKIDLDSDRKSELVRVLYGQGVSDKSLTIEIFKGKKKVDTLKNRLGIQPNYRIADVDADGKKEIIIWEGLWDRGWRGKMGLPKRTTRGTALLIAIWF